MRYKQPLRLILGTTRRNWDVPDTRPAVRKNFEKMINCRTPALGAEVYTSETEQKMVYHTCKSKTCPSCGHRATLLWQREQWAALPDIPYVGLCFTMPDVLWPIFRQNRALLQDLAALGAAAIQEWAKATYGVHLHVLVVTHTFGRHLNFHPHLHILISGGGLRRSEGRWIPTLSFERHGIMQIWREAIITYLWEVSNSKELRSDLNKERLRAILRTQYGRTWNIYIARFQSKAQFLRYAGRYIRRPPIAEHRFVNITDREVEFLTKDLKQKRVVKTRYSLQEFVAVLAEHVPEHYGHGVRYFGLLSPRSKAVTSAALFTLLGQQKRRRPQRLSWRNSLRKYFGIDPLCDSRGEVMHWVSRRKPVAQ